MGALADALRRLLAFYALQIRLVWEWRPGRVALVRRAVVTLAVGAQGRVSMRWQFDLPGQWYVRAQAPASNTAAASAWSTVLRYDVIATTHGTLQREWRAQASGLDAAVMAYSAGPGAIEVSAAGLPPSSSVAWQIHAGTCASPGRTLVRLAAMGTDDGGRVVRRVDLSEGHVLSVSRSGAGGGQIALELRAGDVIRCAQLWSRPVAVATIPTAVEATALGSDGHSVWVVEGLDGGGMLSRIDPATNIPVERFRHAALERARGVAADARQVFVSSGDGDLLHLDRRAANEIRRRYFGGGGEIALCAGSLWSIDTIFDVLARADVATGDVTATVDLGVRPLGIACGTNAIWVTNTGDGTVSRVDPQTEKVVATIKVPNAYLVAAGDSAVWVSVRPARAASGAVVRIDPTTNLVVARVSVGNEPAGLTLVGDTLYVSMAGEPTVVQVRADSVTARIGLPAKATGITAVAGSIWLLHPRLAAEAGTGLEAGGVSRLNV